MHIAHISMEKKSNGDDNDDDNDDDVSVMKSTVRGLLVYWSIGCNDNNDVSFKAYQQST